MRIYDRDLTGPAAAESGRSQETQRAERESTSALSGSANKSGDRVELSSGFASVSRALASQHADRTTRVHELTAQYQSGMYQPNSMATSHGIVSEAIAGAK